MPKTVHEFSAGGVALSRDPLRVALIRVVAPSGERRWVLPKGLAEDREPLAETAQREVREETGLEIEVGDPVGDVEYWFSLRGVRHHKRVRFFLMWVTGGNLDDHDHEVEEAALVDPEEALALLAYESERKILSDALERSAGHPASAVRLDAATDEASSP